ncbi:MAG: type II toxin-antitoxin system RelE/ParE family toxin [Candidatus Poribacteria bacterium]
MPFEVALPDAVKDQLSHFSRNVRRRIARGIKTLQDFPLPRGNTIRRIQGTDKPIYRLRVGDYCVVYHLDLVRKQVTVLTAVHRQRLERAL